MTRIPASFPVKPIQYGGAAWTSTVLKGSLCTCGTCGRSWDDSIATGWTPTPSGRCPFEYFHSEKG